MTLKDTLILVASKLKVRKRRTIVTIVTASILFGIIATVLITSRGLQNNLSRATQINFGEDIIMTISLYTNLADSPETHEKALELYTASNDPNKQSPFIEEVISEDYTHVSLDTTNPFTIAAFVFMDAKSQQTMTAQLGEMVAEYHGKPVSSIEHFSPIADTLIIDNLTLKTILHDGTITYSDHTSNITVIDHSLLTPFIKLTEQKDDVIQILAPLDYTAKIMGIPVPLHRFATHARFKDYVNIVNQQAIGHRFTGTAITDDQETEVAYEIVGLLPPTDTNLFDPNYTGTINPIELLVRGLGSPGYGRGFIAANPSSTAFNSSYNLDDNNPFFAISTTSIIASFNNIDDAEAFESRYGGVSMMSSYEHMSNQLEIRGAFALIDRIISVFLIIFSIIAMVIMVGTVNRVVDDERQTIALYRAVGASTKNITQVFAAYIFTLATLIIVAATVTGLVLSGVITALNTSLVTTFISLAYNLPDLAPAIFIGFDLRILVVYLAVIVVSLICLLLVLNKLTSKDIIKDLRK